MLYNSIDSSHSSAGTDPPGGAVSKGGGIFIASTAPFLIRQNTFSNNYSSTGGAIYCSSQCQIQCNEFVSNFPTMLSVHQSKDAKTFSRGPGASPSTEMSVQETAVTPAHLLPFRQGSTQRWMVIRYWWRQGLMAARAIATSRYMGKA